MKLYDDGVTTYLLNYTTWNVGLSIKKFFVLYQYENGCVVFILA